MNATRIEQAEPVTAAGVARSYPDAKRLVTDNCIKPIKRE